MKMAERGFLWRISMAAQLTGRKGRAGEAEARGDKRSVRKK